MITKFNLRNFNFRLIFWILILAIIGILSIGSAKESLQFRQLAGVVAGFLVMLILTFIDYNKILKFYWVLYAINLVLLVLVHFWGDSSNNSQRWLDIFGVIRFQPSELAKILLILFYAQFIMNHKDRINTFSTLLKSIALVLPPMVLILNQPDLSTTIMIAVLFCILLFMGGLSYKIILGVLAVAIPVFFLLLFFVLQPDQTILEEYQQNRILSVLYPEKYSLSTAYQQQNSITAIGSGQLWGKGLYNDSIDSVKNGNFVSEAQTDFIFSVIGEELGFVGGSAILILEMLIALECFGIARRAMNLSGSLIASGVGGLIIFQSFINIGVATGILPTTGIPLPFVSYGLTSLISIFIGVGVVLNVGLQRKSGGDQNRMQQRLEKYKEDSYIQI